MRGHFFAWAARPLRLHANVAAGDNDEEPWMARTLDIPYILYQGNNTRALHHHWNVGKEAMTYSKFIVDYYDCLPDVSVIAIHFIPRQDFSHYNVQDCLSFDLGPSASLVLARLWQKAR